MHITRIIIHVNKYITQLILYYLYDYYSNSNTINSHNNSFKIQNYNNVQNKLNNKGINIHISLCNMQN
jgi:hypothetical protein